MIISISIISLSCNNYHLEFLISHQRCNMLPTGVEYSTEASVWGGGESLYTQRKQTKQTNTIILKNPNISDVMYYVNNIVQ